MRTQKKTAISEISRAKFHFPPQQKSAYIDYLPGSLCVEAHFALLSVSGKKNSAKSTPFLHQSKAPENGSPMLLSIPYVYATIRSFVQKSFT